MKEHMQSAYKIEAASHPGVTGKVNEDRYNVTPFLAGKKGTPSIFAVVCDGIGGHKAGEVAAEMGVSIISDAVLDGDPAHPQQTITNAIEKASNEIYEASQSDHERKGMGATCACAWIIDGRLYTANAGDSRIYLVRDNYIIQLTTDHTWIREALDAGIINDEHVKNHPNAHVIRRYLGSKTPPEPDFRLWFFEGEGDADAKHNQGLRLKPDDVLLLCSDGLTDLVSDAEIRDVVRSKPLQQACEHLIDMANLRGGHDNITVVFLKVPPNLPKAAVKQKKRRVLTTILAGLILAFTLLSAVILGMTIFERINQGEISPSPIYTEIDRTIEEEIILTPSASNTPINATISPTSFEPVVPQATITPWPTHTSVP